MTEALVLAASVAVKWHLPDEDDVATANLLLGLFAAGGLRLVAPDVFRPEVASAIAAATLGRAPRLLIPEADRAITGFLATGGRDTRQWIFDPGGLSPRS